MPRSLLWPDPLPIGTPVVITRGIEKGVRGVILSTGTYDLPQKPRWYGIDMPDWDKAVQVAASKVKPLDLKDPEDLEVWLDE